MFILDVPPAIAEALVLHHLQLAAALFELTSNDNGDSLIEQVDALEIDANLKAIFNSFIYNMDGLLSDTLPTPIPDVILCAAARAQPTDGKNE